ncbi:hypothetical protein D3C79_970310 [compost metagenome]
MATAESASPGMAAAREIQLNCSSSEPAICRDVWPLALSTPIFRRLSSIWPKIWKRMTISEMTTIRSENTIKIADRMPAKIRFAAMPDSALMTA